MRESYKDFKALQHERMAKKVFTKDLRDRTPSRHVACALDYRVLKSGYKTGYITEFRYPKSIERLAKEGFIQEVGYNRWKIIK